jgi:hypothetical protein
MKYMESLSSSSSSDNNRKTGSSTIRCEICGLPFDTLAAKNEHIKLEHVEHKPPTGVG